MKRRRETKRRLLISMDTLESRLCLSSGLIVEPSSGLTTSETGQSASFTVRLAAKPRSDVTVQVRSTDPTEGLPGPATLTFTPTNWSTPRSVVVTGQNDFADNFNVAYQVALEPSGLSSGAGTPLGPTLVPVTNLYNRAEIERVARLEIEMLRMAEHASHPMHGDTVSQAEHDSVMSLVSLDQATSFAIRSGNWSDPATWMGSRVPGQNDRVVILSGRTVRVDGMIASAVKTLRVSGTLDFAPEVNTQLRVDTVVVDPDGTLTMGTEARPIDAARTATLLITGVAAIDRAWDPYGLSRGLISHGTVSIVGAAKDSRASLATMPGIGATKLRLAAAPRGWRVGDQVVLPGTSATEHQDEAFTVVSLVGNEVGLNRAVQFARTAPVGQPVPLANLTRNAVIRSQTTADIGRRGHVMFMHSDRVGVANAAFLDLGRTDKSIAVNDAVLDDAGRLRAGTGTNPRGRYALHVHRAGVDHGHMPIRVEGSVVQGSPGWGFVNHSSNVEFVDDVSYNVYGSGFASEDGDEIGGFYDSLSIRSYGTDTTGIHDNNRENKNDRGYTASGFWISGPGVKVERNTAAGHINQNGAGYVYYPGPKASRSTPFTGFRDNNTFGSTSGMHFWNTSPYDGSGRATDTQHSVVTGGTFSNVHEGLLIFYSNNVRLSGVEMYGNPARIDGYGVGGNNSTLNLEVIDTVIKGFRYGVQLPYGGVNNIRGGVYNNRVDLFIRFNDKAVPRTDSDGQPEGDAWPRTVNISGVTFETTLPSKQNTILYDGPISLSYGDPNVLFLPDYVYWDNQQLYYTMQAPTATIRGTAVNGEASPLEGMTNAQAWATYRLAMAGVVAPSTARTQPWVNGLVGPRATYDPSATQVVANPTTNKVTGYSARYFGPDGAVYNASGTYSLPRTGWNLVRLALRTGLKTFLIYRDAVPPTWKAASALQVSRSVVDNPNGSMKLLFQVFDRGASWYVWISFDDLKSKVQPDGRLKLGFQVADKAGNVTSGTVYVSII